MKQLFLFSLLFLIVLLVQSQDTIVTNQGDTIACKITRVTNEFIHFTVFDKSGIVLMRSRLPMSGIRHYHQPTAQERDINSSLPPMDDPLNLVLEDYSPSKFRLSINTGYTYQFGGYDGLPASYKKQLQSLWNVGGDLVYYPSENVGIGLKYSQVFTEANQDFDPPVFFSPTFGVSRIRNEKVRFKYFGLSLLYRNVLYGNQAVHYFLTGGLLNYRTDLKADGIPFYQDGDTIGVTFGMLYDFLLFEHLGLGAGAEVLIANLSEYDNNGSVVSADFNISRIDLSIGIRFYK